MAPMAVAGAGSMPVMINKAIVSQCDNVATPPDTTKRCISIARVFFSDCSIIAPEDICRFLSTIFIALDSLQTKVLRITDISPVARVTHDVVEVDSARIGFIVIGNDQR